MTARRPGALLVVVLCALLVPLTTSSAPDSPSCRFRTMNTTWEECHHFKLSHYCCSGAVHFEEGEVNATTVVNVQGSTRTARTANITFSAATDVGSSFLLRLARGCSAYTECFDVAVAAFGDVEVELAFVPADAPYKVTRLDNVKFQDWLSLTTTNGSAETSFLHDSGILLDILGSDAVLRVYSPEGHAAVPDRLATGCLALTSSATSISCSGCDCGPGLTRSYCFERPSGGNSIRVSNVTGFFNGSQAARNVVAVLQVGNACRTATQIVALLPGAADGRPSKPKPSPQEAASVLAAVCASLAALTVLALLSACLYLRLRRRGRRRGDLAEAAEEEVPIARGPYRAVLLYRSDPRLQEVVRGLRDVLGHSDSVEIRDPYEEPMLMERNPTVCARDLLHQTNVIFIASENAFQRPQDTIHDSFFEAAKSQVECHPTEFDGGRVLTLLMDASLQNRISAPWDQRVYFLPNKIENLLSDIPGAPTVNGTPEISNYLRHLSRAIQQCTRHV